MYTTALIAADPTPPVPALGAGSLAEWGLMGALVLLTFQKGWEVFAKKEDAESALVKQLIEGIQGAKSQKDATESDLVKQLIEGLRENQAQMLGQMVRMTERSHDDIKELKDAIVALNKATHDQLDEQREEFEEFKQALARQNDAISGLRLLVSQLRKGLCDQ